MVHHAVTLCREARVPARIHNSDVLPIGLDTYEFATQSRKYNANSTVLLPSLFLRTMSLGKKEKGHFFTNDQREI